MPERSKKPTRHGMVIGVKPEKLEEYKRLHADAWPGVLSKIAECNIRNYSIYLFEKSPEEMYLFSYFEYYGDDFEADMARMDADPTTKEWLTHTDPCQIPVEGRPEGSWWCPIEEVFYTE